MPRNKDLDSPFRQCCKAEAKNAKELICQLKEPNSEGICGKAKQ